MKYILVCTVVLYLSSSACEARKRHHHYVRHHHTNPHRCPVPSRRSLDFIKFGPVDTAKDWAEAKEEVPFTQMSWIEMADKNRMPFTKFVHVEPIPSIRGHSKLSVNTE